MKKIILVFMAILTLNMISCGGNSGSGGGGGSGGGTANLYDIAIKVTGDNNSNGIYEPPLDDTRMPFDGDEVIYYFNSLSPVPPSSTPQMAWEASNKAYIEFIEDVSAAELNNFWVMVAQPDPGSAANQGNWSPVFGVFITITDQNGTNCTSLLVHYVIIGEDPNHNYLYAAQIQKLDTATGCVQQLEDNRTVIFGL